MNLIEEVRPEVYFYLASGASIKNVPELVLQLKKAKENVFLHHVNTEKNDFANWIRDIYKDEQLSNKLFAAKTKKAIIKELENALKEEKVRLKEEKKLKEKEEKKKKEEMKKGVRIIETPKKKSEILKLLKV